MTTGVPYTIPTDYTGLMQNVAPMRSFPREPLATDKKYRIGQLVLLGKNPSTGSQGDLWYLSKFDGSGNAVWLQLLSGAGSPGVDSLTTDDGPPVVDPDGNGNINIFGGTSITTSGQGPSTVTINLDADVANEYVCDVGTATPSSNSINVLGGTGLATVGVGATITINASASVPTTFTSDSGVATPALNNLNVLGGTGISTSGSGSTLTIDASVDVATSYLTDSGSAVPAANVLTIAGGSGVATSGSGSTVTIDFSGTVADTFETDSGSATPSLGILQILGGTGISTSGATNVVTIDADTDVATSYVCDSGSATPASNILNVIGGGNTSTSGSGDTITITSTGALTSCIEVLAGGPTSMVVDTCYIANTTSPTLCELTLPTTSAQGSIIEVIGKGTGGWQIQQNASQTIREVDSVTTAGVTGTITPLELNATLTMRCITADTEWSVISSTGNLTFV